MGIWRGMKRVTKPLVDVPAWMDAQTVTDNAKTIWAILTRYLVPYRARATRVETFIDAKQRFGLNIQDIYRMQRVFLSMACIFLGLALITLGYTGYLLSHGNWHAALISCVMLLLVLALAFRYHFWWFQIKSRKLGCTLNEWFHCGVMRSKR